MYVHVQYMYVCTYIHTHLYRAVQRVQRSPPSRPRRAVYSACILHLAVSVSHAAIHSSLCRDGAAAVQYIHYTPPGPAILAESQICETAHSTPSHTYMVTCIIYRE